MPVLASNTALDEFLGGLPVELRFRPRDAESLADALLAFAAAGPPSAPRRGAELRRRVVAGHSVESWADAVTEIVAAQTPRVTSSPWRRSPRSRRSSAVPRARRPRGAAVSPLARPARATFGRRVLGIASLAVLDTLGLALGLYLALVLRSVVFGDPSSGACSGGRVRGVAAVPRSRSRCSSSGRRGCTPTRERRAGLGRDRLVARARRADRRSRSGYGHGYDFTRPGLIPTALVTCALAIGLLRAAYDSITLELQRLLHVRKRRAPPRRRSRALATLRAHALRRSGRHRVRVRRTSCRPSVTRSRSERDSRWTRPDELILTEGDFDEAAVLEIVETAHRGGVKVRIAPKTTELLLAARRVRARPGRAAVRAAAAGARRHGLGRQARRSTSSSASVVVLVGLPLWLLIALAIKLDSRGPVLYRDRRVGRRRARVRDAQVPHDGARARPSSRRARGARTRRGGALFKIRDDPRVTRVGRVLRRLSLDELPQVLNVLARRDEPRRPAAAARCATTSCSRTGTASATSCCPGMTGLWQISGPLDAHLRRPRAARLLLPRELVDLARHLDPRQDASRRARGAARRLLTAPSSPLRYTVGHEGAEDPRRRVGGRPRLPLRLHARVVAALEGALRGRRRPDRDAVPRQAGRVALVADGAEPDATVEGESFAARPRRARAAEGRPLPAPRRGAARTTPCSTRPRARRSGAGSRRAGAGT